MWAGDGLASERCALMASNFIKAALASVDLEAKYSTGDENPDNNPSARPGLWGSGIVRNIVRFTN